MRTALTIAGSDLAGAGIQADLKTSPLTVCKV
jgi:hydroxymethylpyrimidine/phosphomethylpyrimidine kinase